MTIELDVSGRGMTSQRTRDRLIERLRAQGIRDENLLQIMASVPRHLFLDEAMQHMAYEDKSLPIKHGQTISQPYVVALMTSALFEIGRLGRVLEIGTGCGYQTAILSQLSHQVYTVERIKALQMRARELLRTLRVRNVQYRHADGFLGWTEQAPFDGIIVTAAPREIPQELLDQLAPGGRMVIPIGSPDEQVLQLVTRNESGFEITQLEKVRFVTLLRGTA